MKLSSRDRWAIYSVLRVDKSQAFTGKAYERGEKQVIPYHAIADHVGNEIMVGSFGDLVVGGKQSDVSAAFQYFVDPDKVIETNTGTGAASIDASRLKVAASGGAGTCEVKSRSPITYRPGLNAFAEFTAAFGPYAAGTTQECGVYDYGGNGYALSIDANNKLVVTHYRGGATVSTKTQGDAVNGFGFDQLDGTGESGFTYNPQYMNIFRVVYGYLGIASAILEVYGGALLGWIPFHVIEIYNTTSSLIIDDPHLRLTFRVTSNGTNDVAMYSGSWLGGSIGPKRNHAQNSQFAAEYNKTALTGTAVLLSIRVDSTFKSKTNKLPVDLHELTTGLVNNKPSQLKVIRNGTLTAHNFNAVDADSCVSFDVAATAISGGRLIRSYGLSTTTSLEKTYEPGEIRLIADDILSLVLVTAGTNVEASGAFHWDELR